MYHWHYLDSKETVDQALVVADSNAFAYNTTPILNSVILAIHPIFKKTSPEPIWLSVPLLRRSFLTRIARFRSSRLLDSYFHPYEEKVERSVFTNRLKDIDVWYQLLKQISTTNPIHSTNQIYLISNPTDPLRDVEQQNTMYNYNKIWEWKESPHSLLAFQNEERLKLKQIFDELTQDKGL